METHGLIRALLVDDYAEIRLVVRSVLKRYPVIEVVGEAENGEEALEAVETLRPSLIFMDINMPRMNGVESTRRMKSRYPEVVIIGLTLNDDIATLARMQKAGVCTIVNKERVFEDIDGAIQIAMASFEQSTMGPGAVLHPQADAAALGVDVTKDVQE